MVEKLNDLSKIEQSNPDFDWNAYENEINIDEGNKADLEKLYGDTQIGRAHV